MRRFTKVVLLVVLMSVVGACYSQAATLWYNGDFNGVNGLANESNTFWQTNPWSSRVYDDFVVGNGGWNINSVWSNNLQGFTGVNEAIWEIRSGISSGNGGTLLYSGRSSATETGTGRYLDLGSDRGSYYEYTIMVTGLGISLSPGTYWLAVVPIGHLQYESFVSTTSGANAIGSPAGNNGNAYWNSSFYSANWQRTSDYYYELQDFSMGIGGEALDSVVPEPASMALLGLGLAGMVLRCKKSV